MVYLIYRKTEIQFDQEEWVDILRNLTQMHH